MPNKLPITIAFCAALAAAGLATSARSAPNVSYFRLDNGLELVVIPDHRVPVITHMVWYKVGSADEPPGKSGIAHFLEHLMFKGTARHPMGLFSQRVYGIGGQENAFTSSDYTGYFQRVPRDQLATVMDFEADRMTGLVLTDAVVVPELDVVLEERNQRVANSPGARLGEEMQAALYLNHPYGRPVIGWRHEIEKLNREDALAFYRRYYTPNNAVVVIAGDVTAEAAKSLADTTYGAVVPRAEIGPRVRPQEPEQHAVRQLTLADRRVEQPSVQRQYLAPSAATAKSGESEALEVLAHVLGNGANSRLYRELVVNQAIAVTAGAWYQSSALDLSKFGVYGTPRPGIELSQVERAIDAVIAEIASSGITVTELERSKTRMIADSVYAQDSQSALARWYGAALTTGSTVEQVRTWPERIRVVSTEAVQDAARTWLSHGRSVTGYLVKDLAQPPEKRS